MSAIPTSSPALDPDRFFDLRTPGAQEWWYFDAISDDGRDALVLIFFAALPFDPEYGLAARRHLRRPDAHPAPFPADHCGISIGWYRKGGATFRRRGRGNPGVEAQAYALHSHRRDAFDHEPDPFRVAVAGSRMERDADGYRLVVDASDWDPSRRIAADLHFRPSAGTVPFEVDLGGDGSPHRWILAAADCRVEGTIAIDGPLGDAVEFRGRGYHDHNAGDEELSAAMRRWEWGRVHDEDRTEIYYVARPHRGPGRSLWISCRDGRPEQIREQPALTTGLPCKNGFLVPYDGVLSLADGEGNRLQRWTDRHVDSGPFYQRWLAEFRAPGSRASRVGFCEHLDTARLLHPLYRWMIPYRLRRPGGRPAGS